MKKILLALPAGLALSGTALAVVNINRATKEELTTLKGVGDQRAQEILDYRKKNGSFKSIDDLEKVPGIGPGLMKQIDSDVTATGKTAVDKPARAGSAKDKSTAAKTPAAPKGDATKSPTATTKSTEKTKPEEKK